MAATIDLSSMNDAQRRIAQTLDKPLFVEAGAGSGKTFTLTQRIAWALAPGSGPDGKPYLDSLDQVLVITFTEAAAREIKERVRSTLRRVGMYEAALSVDDTWISTIHAMCRRILMRYALSLDLDPQFEVLSSHRQEALFDQALDEVMREVRTDPSFRPLFDEFELGIRTQGGSYSGAMGLAQKLVHIADTLPEGLADVTPAQAHESVLLECIHDLGFCMEELGAQKLTQAASAKVVPALEVVRSVKNNIRAFVHNPQDLLDVLTSLKLPNAAGAIKEQVRAAKQSLALVCAEASFAQAAPFGNAVLELARHLDRRYKELKHAGGWLDNNDLVRLAYKAVRENSDIQQALAGRFRLVMVDEFQDTDEMQLGLISLLAGKDAAHLCTVGDAQQSIYRFRGADVEVFRSHGRQIHEEGHVRLDVNYRSHADVLAFVERVCGGKTNPLLEGFMHLDANPARKDAYRAPSLPRIQVEVCGGPGVSGLPRRQQTAVLAAQIADALAKLRDAGERPGNMALLLGVTTNADLYIDAIRSRGMECVVTGGSTFTRAPEVKVIQALLHALANPSDTQSGLFPSLASEVFCLDAEDFCELGTKEQDTVDTPAKRPIDRGMEEMSFFHNHTPSKRLVRAHEVLTQALQDVRSRSVADVLLDIVLNSGWLSRLEAAGTEGRARAANVLAAIRYVRDLTLEMGLGPARAATEFDRWLEATKVPPASLAGDEGGEGAGTVRVMTIHASKGLEFNVCAVSECWGAPRPERQIAFDNQSHEFILRPRELSSKLEIDPAAFEESADRSLALPLTVKYLAAQNDDKEGEAQESARLLYVALTRAREALVLGVAGASSSRGVSLPLASDVLDALCDGQWEEQPGVRKVAYGGSEPARLRCVVVRSEGPKGDTHLVADSADSFAELDGTLPEDIEAIVRMDSSVQDNNKTALSCALYEMDMPLQPAHPWRMREGVFSYSSVHAALEPQPISSRSAAQSSQRPDDMDAAEAADEDRATNLGSAFHELAQAMVESGGHVNEKRIASQIRRWNLSKRAAERLRAALQRWESSSLRAEALSWPQVRAEVPFFLRVSSPYGKYLEGAIDLLCTNPDTSCALVVDYKTGDAGLTTSEVQKRHAMQAEFYAQVLLQKGYSHVEAAFVCVERADELDATQPLVVRYSFDA